MSNTKKIIFHGYLSELHPEAIEVEALTVAEALTYLENYPELFAIRHQLEFHKVSIEGIRVPDDLYKDNFLEEIHIHPFVGGSGGDGGFLQVVIGVTLVVLAVTLPVSILPAKAATALLASGASVALGGVIQLLSPSPEVDLEGETGGEETEYLSASRNTVAIGTRIPLLYGTRKVGGHYLSFDVDAVDVTDTPYQSGVSGSTSYYYASWNEAYSTAYYDWARNSNNIQYDYNYSYNQYLENSGYTPTPSSNTSTTFSYLDSPHAGSYIDVPILPLYDLGGNLVGTQWNEEV